jgi:protein translocase SecG subunit
MALLLGFLTFVLVVNCLFLMLLVLIQLPKKEAGAGVAFGAGATDALFGAGSGNALTKMTKYAATFFVGLALMLSLINSHRAKERNQGLDKELLNKANAAAPVLPAASPTNTTQTITITNPPIATPTNALQIQTTTTATQAVVTPSTSQTISNSASGNSPAAAPARVP